MAYSELKNKIKDINYDKSSLEGAVLSFIRESCTNLRFESRDESDQLQGKSVGENMIPFNMEKDIDRLCFENAIERFLNSGKKSDAFDVYFCYLDMFVGDYKKTRRMIELLSEFEANGSGLLMKHRDHYSHSVYVFCLGLAIYETNDKYREIYKEYYQLTDNNEAACHFLKYWGLSSLFHDIGYPFELPFEQVASYFEVDGNAREKKPFISYNNLSSFTKLNKATQRRICNTYGLGTNKILGSTDELFAYSLHEKLGKIYCFSEKEMLDYLLNKPTNPNRFGYYMDHAYFSATVLFKKLFEEIKVDFENKWDVKTTVDSLTAIILHNSLYKFCVAFYKDKDANIRLKGEWHPLAFMLMLCDELQCWDRTAYGRNSKLELHPMNCKINFAGDIIKAEYIFDADEELKISKYKAEKEKDNKAKLKAYSSYDRKEIIVREDGKSEEVSEFQADIERIVDLSEIRLEVSHRESTKEDKTDVTNRKTYLSNSNFISLYTFAGVLHGMWSVKGEWEEDKKGTIEKYLTDRKAADKLQEDFDKLSLEYKLSNINQAKAFDKYLNAIGCFYTDKPVDFVMIDEFKPEELEKIGPMEHERWLKDHYGMGWEYIPEDVINKEVTSLTGIDADDSNEDNRKLFKKEKSKLRENIRKHWDLIPDDDVKDIFNITEDEVKANYNRIGKIEQDKDTVPMECMLALLKLYDGIRIYRL